jgi:hypothetical protein
MHACRDHGDGFRLDGYLGNADAVTPIVSVWSAAG